MTALRQRMLEELQRHNYSKETIRLYLFAVKDFARHFRKSPDLLTQEHMREFQLYLLNERKLTAQTVAGRITALRFFFVKVLRRPDQELDLVYPKLPERLPAVLSEEEVAKLIESASSAYYRVILTTLYATGMRRAELARLKLADIDSQRMVIRVREGKGGKDRDVTLSPRLLEILREYWKWRKPQGICSQACFGLGRTSRLIPRPSGMRFARLRGEQVSKRESLPTRYVTAGRLICWNVEPT